MAPVRIVKIPVLDQELASDVPVDYITLQSAFACFVLDARFPVHAVALVDEGNERQETCTALEDPPVPIFATARCEGCEVVRVQQLRIALTLG